MIDHLDNHVDNPLRGLKDLPPHLRSTPIKRDSPSDKLSSHDDKEPILQRRADSMEIIEEEKYKLIRKDIPAVKDWKKFKGEGLCRLHNVGRVG
ncbi:hypothetical protein CROQUDRAFT_100689 [Cronartium quercuum f. sp. fusiforme G11]|uniref:Uncharacterized protein n=1 Tax=Cronartium quercuum f. sp. fusiforme G11 TaxID=708437 RepID=A0A9P6N5Y5_9BASI|nr:hypothetical protein CROQUDRAFT_100689 [Cronartium quercuum f. sp. fusiforme G11]